MKLAKSLSMPKFGSNPVEGLKGGKKVGKQVEAHVTKNPGSKGNRKPGMKRK